VSGAALSGDVRDAGLRVGLDATPLLGTRTGVGRYVHGLLTGLDELQAPRPVLALFSLRGHLPSEVPGRPARVRLPARLLHALWQRAPFPPVELLTGRVDVFHAGNFVLPPALRAAGVVTVHDLTFLRHPDTVTPAVLAYRDLVPASLRRAAGVVTVSAAVRDEVCAEYDVDPAVVTVAPNGVDNAWSRAEPPSSASRARLGLPDRYLLFVGNVEPRKGLPLLVRAHREARRAHREVPPLVVVGPRGWGDAWAGSQPDPADVLQLGFLPDADLRRVVAGADALCLPSRYEGFGLPVLEALACGRRVLASDVPAHREVGGEHILVLPQGDVDAWADALARAQGSDPPEEVAARRAHAAAYTWRRSAERHLEAWRAAARS
jgi:glycosyltransferase involved in cell wall biosynthesis